MLTKTQICQSSNQTFGHICFKNSAQGVSGNRLQFNTLHLTFIQFLQTSNLREPTYFTFDYSIKVNSPVSLSLNSFSPDLTVAPSSTKRSSITPAAGDGTGTEVWNTKPHLITITKSCNTISPSKQIQGQCLQLRHNHFLSPVHYSVTTLPFNAIQPELHH